MDNKKIELITNHNISPEVLNLIKDSKKYVVLITPWLYPWNHLKNEILSAIDRNVRVTLIMRPEALEKVESQTDESPFDESEEGSSGIISMLYDFGVKIFAYQNLHTKLYLTEKNGIFTSMNLIEYSMKSNEELGLTIDDKELLKELTNYASELNSKSHRWYPKGRFDDFPARLGSCIRCGKKDVEEKGLEEGQLDKDGNYLGDNLCDECLSIWKKYGTDENYSENYCFDCGKKHKTSVKAPLCKDCTYNRMWFDDEYNNLVDEAAEKFEKDRDFTKQ